MGLGLGGWGWGGGRGVGVAGGDWLENGGLHIASLRRLL